MHQLLLPLVILCLAYNSSAQSLNCGVTHPHHKLSYSPTTVAKTSVAPSIEIAVGNCEEQFVIPVVFHVFNSSGASAIPMSQIQSALDKANEDFNLQNSDAATIDPLFDPLKAGLNVKFVLAKLDPNGQATTGVNYYPTQSGFGGINMNNTVASYAWDNYKYVNIYVMRDLYNDGVTNNSGVAWYPDNWMSNNNLARVVYNDLYLGNSGTSVASGEFQSVFTHELGHFFNLKHTFENGCAGAGDDVGDTPPTTGSVGCSNAWDCGGYTNGENYMDYNSTCYKMFTKGQIQRVKDALYNHPTRNSLWTKSNLIATGNYSDYDYATNTPNPKMLVSDTTITVGQTVDFEDLSCYLPDARQWTFVGGMPSTSTQKTETVTYPTAGIYPVTLAASNSNGTGITLTINIHVIDCQIAEDFETTAVGNLPVGWSEDVAGTPYFTNYGTLTHNGNTILPAGGNAAIYSGENWDNSANGPVAMRLITKAIDLTTLTNPVLSYDDIRSWDNAWPVAKPNHSIDIAVSTSPQGPWNIIHTDVANDQQLTEWRQVDNIDFSAYAGQQIYISWFTDTHHYYWRMDNLCIQETAIVSANSTITLDKKIERLPFILVDNILRVGEDFYLYNMQGQLLYEGRKEAPFNISMLTAGLYILKAKNSDQHNKFIKNKGF